MAASLILAVSTLLSFAAAAPVQDHLHPESLKARQAVSCNVGTGFDFQATYDSSCWDTLNIMPYLTNWKATTPTCTDAESRAGQILSCCVASEPWSSCFLRLATRQQSVFYDCTQVSSLSKACPLGTTLALNPSLDPSIASQVNYVVLNIVTINNFFTNYYTALQKVASIEQQNLTSLISSSSTKLNLNVGVNLQDAMTALTLGLAFPQISTPSTVSSDEDGTTTTYSNPTKRDPQTSNTGTSSSSAPASSVSILPNSCSYSWIAKYFNDGLHHRKRQAAVPCTNGTQTDSKDLAASGSGSGSTPSTLSALSPPVIIFTQALKQSPNVASAMWPSTPSTPSPTTATLTDLLSNSTASIASILDAGLSLIMTDIGTFIAFAGNGIFSSPLPSTTYPSSYTSGFFGALDTYLLSAILSLNSVSATPGAVTVTDPCDTGPVCDTYYWSPVTGRQYSFSGGSGTYSFIEEALSVMDVDLPVVFDGAYNCTFAGKAGGEVVGINADGSLDMACLSVLPMYVGKGGCPQGAVLVGGKCPFG